MIDVENAELKYLVEKNKVCEIRSNLQGERLARDK